MPINPKLDPKVVARAIRNGYPEHLFTVEAANERAKAFRKGVERFGPGLTRGYYSQFSRERFAEIFGAEELKWQDFLATLTEGERSLLE